MASLMENLLDLLNEEWEEYKALLRLSELKTGTIVRGDVPELQRITEAEQTAAGRITRLDKRREQIVGDIALVLNQDTEALTITKLIGLMEKQETEQGRLVQVTAGIRETLDRFKLKNDENRELLKQSLDLIDFTVNVYQSTQQGPETANYGKNYKAGNRTENSPGTSMFDAKQ